MKVIACQGCDPSEIYKEKRGLMGINDAMKTTDWKAFIFGVCFVLFSGYSYAQEASLLKLFIETDKDIYSKDS